MLGEAVLITLTGAHQSNPEPIIIPPSLDPLDDEWIIDLLALRLYRQQKSEKMAEDARQQAEEAEYERAVSGDLGGGGFGTPYNQVGGF